MHCWCCDGCAGRVVVVEVTGGVVMVDMAQARGESQSWKQLVGPW